MDKYEAYKELTLLKSQGVNVTEYIVESAKCNGNDSVPDHIKKFIEDTKLSLQSESTKFFENLRHLAATKNHKLYGNILNESLDEIGKLKCLSSYMTTAVIQMESMTDPDKIKELRQSVGLEIVSEALSDYYNGRDYNKINEAMSYLRHLVK